MKKKALITGITGQDGSYLAELLLSKDYEVHGLLRRTSLFNTGRIDHLYRDRHEENVSLFLHHGDMTDSSSLMRVIQKTQPDEIYNLAAQSHVAVSFEEPEYTANSDALGALRILEAVRILGLAKTTRFYQASTSELYGLVRETPQRETTPFHPRSPYAVAKLYAYWITINYREAYGMFACNGILFNHESPVRGETFVTRKITRALGRIKVGLQKCLYLGNLDSKRDWGHARDYVYMQWLMLQQEKPEDFVIATGEQHSVREFVTRAAAEIGIKIDWRGAGIEETGHNAATGKRIVRIDPAYFRPAEVETLLGDATKARTRLGWSPKTSFAELVSEMADKDLRIAEREKMLQERQEPGEGLMAGDYILAIDQGTTSSRAIVFDRNQKIAAVSRKEFKQYFPKPGWVEHDPEEIWESVVWTCRDAIAKAGIAPSAIAAIGITNQRETTVLWDRNSGKPVYPAIVWQDRRTAAMCAGLKKAGHEKLFTRKTGLLLDPYFSGTKIAWLLNQVKGLRRRAQAGEIAFGTIDSFLIWRLTGGKRHATDATNASRTLLYNIASNKWDRELLDILRVPEAILPEALDCAADFGTAERALFGAAIPILGVAGDQQAAAIGNACFIPGMMKSTYGTGCFALLNTGADRVASKNRLLTTIAYRLNGKTVYALEGSIFMAGASVQWLRDGLKIIANSDESGKMAAQADPAQDVYLVPAFVGLGAPWWDAEARGAIFGLTRGAGPNEIARATLEAVCYQTHDLLFAMQKDWKGASGRKTVLRVDGGMVASDWTMQRLADILNAPVDRPTVLETTALGAAWLAGSRAGIWPDMKGFANTWALETRFKPRMKAAERDRKLKGWHDAVNRTLTR